MVLKPWIDNYKLKKIEKIISILAREVKCSYELHMEIQRTHTGVFKSNSKLLRLSWKPEVFHYADYGLKTTSGKIP